jgi:hypothetical protein
MWFIFLVHANMSAPMGTQGEQSGAGDFLLSLQKKKIVGSVRHCHNQQQVSSLCATVSTASYLKKPSPRTLNIDGSRTDQQPSNSFSPVAQGTENPALGRYK